MNDYVSLYIYTLNYNQQDLRIYFQRTSEKLCVPLSKVASGKSKVCATSSEMDVEESNDFKNVKQSPIPKNGQSDKAFLKHNNEVNWNNALEGIWSKLGFQTMKRGNFKLIDLLRVYSNQYHKHFHHATFGVQISLQDIEMLSGRIDGVVVSLSNLKRSMVCRQRILYIAQNLYKTAGGFNNIEIIERQTLGTSFEEISPSNILFVKDKQFNIILPSELFSSAGYTELDKECLYEEFIKLSFPFRTVVLQDIRPLLALLGYKNKEDNLFRAMDDHNSGELNIYQFMLGLTAMDPVTKHGDASGEFRSRHIFRYYDADQDGHLNEKEVEHLVRDIAVSQNQSLTPELLKNAVRNAFKAFDVEFPCKVSLVNYLTCLGSLRFRGTSLLYRASNHVPTLIRKKSDTSKCAQHSNPTSASSHHGLTKMNSATTCIGTDHEEIGNREILYWGSGYSLADHAVMVRRSGTLLSSINILDMERAGELSNTGLETSFDHEESHSLSDSTVCKEQKRKMKKHCSNQAFNVKSLPNEILGALRYFEHATAPGQDSQLFKERFDWGTLNKTKLVKYIMAICDSMKSLLENEPRLIVLSSPCYVLGDLHGNFHDLISFEKALWRLGPRLTPANILFLGDYVDRGQHGVEVVIYLLAQKLKAPNQFHLLRGNHEIRDVQKFFSFYSECLSKFGEEIGLVVWNEINAVFDRMPLAAVIDQKIFCIHGGIPNMNGTLEKINEIPCPLSDPETECQIAWQIMWNDPADKECLTEEMRIQLASNNGFADNLRRQTAFVFDQNAFDRFLKIHSLTHVIRAHEVKQAGFQIQQEGRLLTVFSSSQYCGMNNEAACVLIHDKRIRIIRLDTS